MRGPGLQVATGCEITVGQSGLSGLAEADDRTMSDALLAEVLGLTPQEAAAAPGDASLLLDGGGELAVRALVSHYAGGSAELTFGRAMQDQGVAFLVSAYCPPDTDPGLAMGDFREGVLRFVIVPA